MGTLWVSISSRWVYDQEETLLSTRSQRSAPSTHAGHHHHLLCPPHLLIQGSHPHPGVSSLPGSMNDSTPGETSFFQHHCLSHHATGNKCDQGHHASCQSAIPRVDPPPPAETPPKVSQTHSLGRCKPTPRRYQRERRGVGEKQRGEDRGWGIGLPPTPE